MQRDFSQIQEYCPNKFSLTTLLKKEIKKCHGVDIIASPLKHYVAQVTSLGKWDPVIGHFALAKTSNTGSNSY